MMEGQYKYQDTPEPRREEISTIGRCYHQVTDKEIYPTDPGVPCPTERYVFLQQPEKHPQSGEQTQQTGLVKKVKIHAVRCCHRQPLEIKIEDRARSMSEEHEGKRIVPRRAQGRDHHIYPCAGLVKKRIEATEDGKKKFEYLLVEDRTRQKKRRDGCRDDLFFDLTGQKARGKKSNPEQK